MRVKRFLAWPAGLLLALLLSACGGGGGGTSTTGDINPFVRAAAVATGLDRFLLYPNPVVNDVGAFEVGDVEYALAYYRAIDPNNDKDTLDKWKAANRIGDTSGGQQEFKVIVGDMRDLGYGRKMTAHKNPDGTMAFVVENYLVGAYGGYSPLNLEAAIQGVKKWHLGTNAIEFSPGPNGPPGANFVKFYTFDPTTGARLNTISLDGRPAKAMPTVCISCHGGRGDPLTPPDATGKRLFPLVMNSFSQHRGDVQAQLHPFETAALDYSTIPGYSRAEQEAAIKEINKMILCSFSIPAGVVPLPDETCRRVATPHEHQGTAAAHLKDMYGFVPGVSTMALPDPVSKMVDNYVEASWTAAGQAGLYIDVVGAACRVCHLLRGTGHQADISFETFPQFDAYKDRIKAHTVDRGNMPLAKLIYDKLRSTAIQFQTLANYLMADLTGIGFNAGYPDGNLSPERPIADPGPDRVVRQGATTLSAAMSLFSTAYQWSFVANPGGATLTNPTSAQPTFTAAVDGVYVVQLVTTKGAATSTPKQLTIKVDNTLPYDPTAVRFTGAGGIKDVLQNGAGGCTTCHQAGGNGAVLPPIWYTDYDRSGTGNAATNSHWFYTELRGRVNFTDWIASPLLRKPAGNHHNGGLRAGFDTTAPVGDPARADYDKFVSWIVNGAPE